MSARRDVDVGERLFLYRDALGWTQVEMAERAGIARGTVVLTENGETRPRLPTLRRLARAFGVSVEEFLGDGEPKPRLKAQAPQLIDRLRRMPSEDRHLILRGLHEDWTPDPSTDARAMERAIEFLRETGASADDVRRALLQLDPLAARRLLGESKQHREEVAHYWQRLLFEAVAKGELSAQEAARKSEAFGAA